MKIEQTNIIPRLNALWDELLANSNVGRMFREPMRRKRCELIDDIITISEKFQIIGNEHKAARYYLYALMLWKKWK